MSDDLRAIIASACEEVIRQAPRDAGLACANYSVALAYLLLLRGLPAQIVGGAASWRTGPGQDDRETYNPDIDEQSYHAWVRVNHATGVIYADAFTHSVPTQPPFLILSPEDNNPDWHYAESPLVLPQVEQARERLLCALQSSPPPSS
jgi:transglutaminase-like putative cysteine protease